MSRRLSALSLKLDSIYNMLEIKLKFIRPSKFVELLFVLHVGVALLHEPFLEYFFELKLSSFKHLDGDIDVSISKGIHDIYFIKRKTKLF